MGINFPNPFKKRPVHLETWDYEPYAFEPGRIYVIQFDVGHVHPDAISELYEYFATNGVNVKLVPTLDGKGLKPMEVKRMTRMV
jgi:hypothetical protein